jgi:hypothetical protein
MRAPVLRRPLALLAGLAATGCGSFLGPVAPYDATAVFRPASMVADRETAAPGDVVELTFPDEMGRGILYVLEQEVGGVWAYRYGLIATGEGGLPSEWFVAGDDVAVEDIGVVGPGPDRVRIPETASPGSWRLCTGNAAENVCVRLQLVNG